MTREQALHDALSKVVETWGPDTPDGRFGWQYTNTAMQFVEAMDNARAVLAAPTVIPLDDHIAAVGPERAKKIDDRAAELEAGDAVALLRRLVDLWGDGGIATWGDPREWQRTIKSARAYLNALPEK
jgi:hypothetical protein